MFTGIIQAVGRIERIEPKGSDVRVAINTADLDLGDVALGDSIAVNGICLTAIALQPQGFSADVSGETLACTTFSSFRGGTPVNLEKALTLQIRLGGHLVSGHVDGIGKVVERADDGRSVRFAIESPKSLAKYIAAKGSVCVNGISLTVNRVEGAVFELNIVPHTLEKTTLSNAAIGDAVNLEVDLIARYLERLVLGEQAANPGQPVTMEFLREHGFAK
jgi:riboflavin synthase